MNPDARTSDGSSLQTIEKVRDAPLLPVADCSPKLARSSRASRTTNAVVGKPYNRNARRHSTLAR